MNEEKIELTILMPCLNEVKTVGECIEKALRFLEDNHVNGEVIVSDNGSTDGSQIIAEKCGARVVQASLKGYGSALINGIYAARGKYIIMGDADESYNFYEVGDFLAKLRGGYDLVIGNRFKGGIKPGAMPLLHKYLGNPVLSLIGRWFFSCPCNDFHCGLRGGRIEVLRGLQLVTTGMEFASEMIVKASLRNLKIAEVPVVLYPDGRDRTSHLRTWRDGWRHLRFLLLFSPNWLFLFPGILLMLLGVVVGFWLLPGTQFFFDINTLLYCATFIIIGFNAILFSLFAKVFATNEGFLPKDILIDRHHRIFSLEKGLLIGGLLLLTGIGGSLYSLFFWKHTAFGPLDPTKIQRIIIPSITLIIIGFQTILSSFFLSILQINRK